LRSWNGRKGLDSLFEAAYAELACVYLERGNWVKEWWRSKRAVPLSDRDAERLGILSRVLATAARRPEVDATLLELEQ